MDGRRIQAGRDGLVYVSDVRHPYVVYDYTPSRKRDGSAEFLAGYAGYLQADAFGGCAGIYTGSGGKIIDTSRASSGRAFRPSWPRRWPGIATFV